MSDCEHFKLIQKQCQDVSRWVRKAEKADDVAKAAQFYQKAREQMAAVTEAVKDGLEHMAA